MRSCAVIGLADDDLGQRIHAVIERGGDVDEAELRSHMADQLVAYKCPDTYEFVEGQVRDDAGKVRRSMLAEERSGGA